MNNIKISIVVAIYNIEKYLPRCLNSIVNQSYKNLEIILIDDGSMDNSSSICDAFSRNDKRIKVIHKQNEGLGFARNTGLDIATGDYIAFFDGDDYIDLELASKCVEIIEKYSPDIIDFDNYDVDSNGNVIEGASRVKYGDVLIQKEGIDELVSNIIYNYKNKFRLHNSAWNKLYKLSTLKNNKFKYVSEREFISEDYYSNLILYKIVDTYYLMKDKLYYYCSNASSLSRSFKQDRFEKNVYQYDESVKLAKKLGYSEEVINKIYLTIFFNILGHFKNIFENIEIDDKEKKKKVIGMLTSDFLTNGYKETKKLKIPFKFRSFFFLINLHLYLPAYLMLKINYGR